MDFVHLRVRSHYSFHYGVDGPVALCRAARELGFKALALTDINGLYGVIPFVKAARECGLKPILGAEIRAGRNQATVLARNGRGYTWLSRLLTDRHLEGRFSLAHRLSELPEDCILLSSDLPLLEHLVSVRGRHALYLALGPGRPNAQLARTARRLDLPLAATGDVAFVAPEGYATHRLLRAIGLLCGLADLDEGCANPPAMPHSPSGAPPGRPTGLPGAPSKAGQDASEAALAPRSAYLASTEEMNRRFTAFPEALENTARLADACEDVLRLGQKRLPRYPAAGGDAPSLLARRSRAGARKRYGRLTARVLNRLNHELNIITRMGYADYFLLVADIAAFARRRQIPSCGRGSAANSIVSYALYLTHVDPLAYGLFFERFLNEGRTDMPDVDLDFSWKGRDLVLEHVYGQYGRDRVAMIATHVTFGLRGAVREIAKVHGLPVADINGVTGRLPWRLKPGDTAESLARGHPKCRSLHLEDAPWPAIFAAAAHLDGTPRHLGIHCGGIVIAPEPLAGIVPLERSSNGMVITQWDMYPVEAAGLVKIDLLGNRGLAVVDDGFRNVATQGGPRMDPTDFSPLTDPATVDLIRRGDTMGSFYIESPAMRGLLTKLDCRTYPELVAASSVIRPGVSSSGMMQQFIERHHGKPFTYLHPLLEELLSETYGVMVYQEDVIKVAHALAGMSLAEADGLRKSMSKKRNWERIARYRERFLSGARSQGVSGKVAQEIWRQIESFAGYSFCKAHSASFALLSFQSAYLRAHHPAEFMAAVLSNGGGYYAPFAYVSEARRMGLELRLPCVNESDSDWTGTAGWIRVGLRQLKGLSRSGRLTLLAAREQDGPFASLDDLLFRVPLAPSDVETLIRVGALDALESGASRPELMWRALRWKGTPGATGCLLFQAAPGGRGFPVPEYDRRTQLAMEYDALGFLVSAHPLTLFRESIEGLPLVRARELARQVGKPVTLVGWQVTAKPIRTSRGEPMEFISFEDTTAIYEATLFPRAYRRLAHRTLTRGPYLVRGRVEEDSGHVTVTVRDLELLPRAKSSSPSFAPR